MTKVRFAILGLLIVIALLVWGYYFSLQDSRTLTVAFLDVGQGDAIFVESPSGAQVLIDGGPGRAVLRELGRHMGFFDRTIDVVVATHPDSDHIGGLPDVLGLYSVSRILDPGITHDTPAYRAFLDASEQEPGALFVYARRGHIIDLGGGAYIRTLFPDRDVSNVESNDGSIIMQLVYGDTSFLLTGDAPVSIEQYLSFTDREHLASDVLKVGHHGSRTSSSELFVGWVSPEYGVISRGCDNRYGHPHEEVLATFTNFEIEILDTCEEGTIVFKSDGERVRVK